MVMSSFSTRSTLQNKCDHKLSWDISCSDDSADDEELTSLVKYSVRTSYMKHLKSCLSKNYEKWSKTNISVEELNFCSKMLEKKALRSCMVRSLYQRTMTRIVNEIKMATQNEILYEGFRKKLDLFESIRCDKETQTVDESLEDKKENKTCNVEVLLNNNSNSSNSNSKSLFLETFGESESAINMKLEQAGNDLHTYEELLNMLLSSPKESDIKPEESNSNAATTVNDDTSLVKKRKLVNGNSESFHTENDISQKSITDDSLNNTIPVEHPSAVFLCPTAETLGERNQQQKINDNKVSSSLLVNWSYELFIQNTHLENILMKLKPHKRILVEKRFKDLFGSDITTKQPNSNKASSISEEELNLCRKRIARIIVGELTPFYVEGRIGSRPVFKNLAKKLTDDILCTTLTPDPASIRKTVRGIFVNGKQIYSLKDAF